MTSKSLAGPREEVGRGQLAGVSQVPVGLHSTYPLCWEVEWEGAQVSPPEAVELKRDLAVHLGGTKGFVKPRRCRIK